MDTSDRDTRHTGGSLRREPARGADPQSPGGRAYLRSLARLGATAQEVADAARRRTSHA